MKKYVIILIAALAAIPVGSALADDPDPPTLVTPTPIVSPSDAQAQQFASLVLRFRGGRLLLNNRRARAENIEVVCRHADNLNRFLCVSRLDLSVRLFSGFDRDRHRGLHRSGDEPPVTNPQNNHPPRQDREVARFSCVAALRVFGGPRPSVSVLARDCVRVGGSPTPYPNR